MDVLSTWKPHQNLQNISKIPNEDVWKFLLKGDAKTLAKIMDLEKQARESDDENAQQSLDLSEFVEE